MELVTIALGVVVGLIILQLWKILTESRAPPPEPVKWHLGDITLRSLGAYCGLDWSRSTLVAINGKVYDVTTSLDKFGPGARSRTRRRAALHGLASNAARGTPPPPPGPPCPHPAGKELSLYAGREIARALAKDSLDPKDLSGDCSDLTQEQRERLAAQEAAYATKYDLVGQVGGGGVGV